MADTRLVAGTDTYRLVAVEVEAGTADIRVAEAGASMVLERREEDLLGGDAWIAVDINPEALNAMAREHLDES